MAHYREFEWGERQALAVYDKLARFDVQQLVAIDAQFRGDKSGQPPVHRVCSKVEHRRVIEIASRVASALEITWNPSWPRTGPYVVR